jgi:Surfeit locus protein 2 (SURF2)
VETDVPVLSDEATTFMREYPQDVEISATGKIRFTITGMEFPASADRETLERYLNGRAMKRARIQKANGEYEFDALLPNIVPHKKRNPAAFLFCQLTSKTLPRDAAVVDRHIKGRRYRTAVERLEYLAQERNRAQARKAEKAAKAAEAGRKRRAKTHVRDSADDQDVALAGDVDGEKDKMTDGSECNSDVEMHSNAREDIDSGDDDEAEGNEIHMNGHKATDADAGEADSEDTANLSRNRNGRTKTKGRRSKNRRDNEQKHSMNGHGPGPSRVMLKNDSALETRSSARNSDQDVVRRRPSRNGKSNIDQSTSARTRSLVLKASLPATIPAGEGVESTSALNHAVVDARPQSKKSEGIEKVRAKLRAKAAARKLKQNVVFDVPGAPAENDLSDMINGERGDVTLSKSGKRARESCRVPKKSRPVRKQHARGPE